MVRRENINKGREVTLIVTTWPLRETEWRAVMIVISVPLY